jgi:hypothetical protein
LSRNGCFAGPSAAEGVTLAAGATATMGANAPGAAMEFVADSVEAVPETGRTIAEDGRAFRPAIKTVKSLDEFASAADAVVTASWALTTQLIPNTARRTMTDFLMLFYPEPGRHLTPANAKAFAGDPGSRRALDENLCQLGVKRVRQSTLRRRGKYLKRESKTPGWPLGLEDTGMRSPEYRRQPGSQGADD